MSVGASRKNRSTTVSGVLGTAVATTNGIAHFDLVVWHDRSLGPPVIDEPELLEFVQVLAHVLDVAVDERPDTGDVADDVYVVLSPTRDGIDTDWVDGNPVIPLDDAIDHMMANRAAYEPALELIAEEYEKPIEAFHHRPEPAY